MMLPLTVVTERQAVVTRDLPALPSVQERSAKAAMQDRFSIGLKVPSNAVALFALADTMTDLYPFDSYRN